MTRVPTSAGFTGVEESPPVVEGFPGRASGNWFVLRTRSRQEKILANQQRIERNQAKLDKIVSNQAKLDRILANQKSILAKLR